MAVPNFPTKPGFSGGGGSKSFPKDLNNGSRQFCTNISFVEYSSPLSTTLGGEGISMGGSITLPIPRRLNDNEVILWEEWSGTSGVMQGLQALANRSGSYATALASGVAMGGGGQALSTFTGKQLNPFQFLMFKRPLFKEHTLTWTLAPNSQEESNNLRDIIKECKRAALPPSIGTQAIIEYPKLAQISFKPSGYLFKLKPCVIVAVQVDYTGAGQPSFFKSGAPTIVNLTLQLKEYQLQSAQDI